MSESGARKILVFTTDQTTGLTVVGNLSEAKLNALEAFKGDLEESSFSRNYKGSYVCTPDGWVYVVTVKSGSFVYAVKNEDGDEVTYTLREGDVVVLSDHWRAGTDVRTGLDMGHCSGTPKSKGTEVWFRIPLANVSAEMLKAGD